MDVVLESRERCEESSCCVFFFFSSRRRHTRFDCDWSSDVCSSDLMSQRYAARRSGVDGSVSSMQPTVRPSHVKRWPIHWRSEEHTSELQSQSNLVCRLLLEKKKQSPSRRCASQVNTDLQPLPGKTDVSGYGA